MRCSCGAGEGGPRLLTSCTNRFRCTTTIHCVAFNAAADILAVGTNVETELFTVRMPQAGSTPEQHGRCVVEPLEVLNC